MKSHDIILYNMKYSLHQKFANICCLPWYVLVHIDCFLYACSEFSRIYKISKFREIKMKAKISCFTVIATIILVGTVRNSCSKNANKQQADLTLRMPLSNTWNNILNSKSYLT